jgi:hypothetical protein
VPQTPAEVLETLPLLEKAGDFGADLRAMGLEKGTGGERRQETYLPCFCERVCIAKVGESDEGFVALERMRHYGEEGFNVEHEGKGRGNRL